jgi:uncharacterized membrane protein YGL010W
LLGEFTAFSAIGSIVLAKYGAQQSIWIIIWAQIIGWGIQVGVGHGIFEKRKPALLDSVFQVFVAPFFLVLETLFVLGYKKDLANKVQQNIEVRIAEFNKKSQKKAN